MDKFERWLEAHKHLQGVHNQKLHGNRGAKVSNEARSTNSGGGGGGGGGGAAARHSGNVAKGTASIDKIAKVAGKAQPNADWGHIGTMSDAAKQLDEIMDFAGLKKSASPAPYKKGDKNTQEARSQRHAAYQAKIKQDLAALKKFMKSENKPTSKFSNADDFGYINEQLGHLLETFSP